MGWCMREPYCPLSFAVCNASIPTLAFFEMANQHVRRYTITFNIIFCLKFISAVYHICVTGQLL
jgi:hypothetical protein